MRERSHFAFYALLLSFVGLALVAVGLSGKPQSPSFGPTTSSPPTAGSTCGGSREAILDTTGIIWTCHVLGQSPVWLPEVPLAGTTSSIGGSLLLAGACSTGTVTVTGAQVGWPVEVSTSDGTNIPSIGAVVSGVVTSANTVTVNVCALLSITPSAKTYNVAVLHP